MGRYNRRVEGLDAWELKSDARLRAFAVPELNMSIAEVNAAITEAQSSGGYPVVFLVGNSGAPTIHVQVGWYVIRSSRGEYSIASVEDFRGVFDPKRSGPSPF